MVSLRTMLLFLLIKFVKKFYSIKLAITREEKTKVFQFRNEIYINEYNYLELVKKDIHAGLLYDKMDFSKHTILVYSGSLEKVTATVRLTVWKKHQLPSDIKKKYNIDENILNQVQTVGEVRFLLVQKSLRKSLLALALVDKLYEESVKNNCLPDILFIDSMPGLLNYYRQIGFYPYTNQPASEDVFMMPLALNPFDFAYLKKMRCATHYMAEWYLAIYKKYSTAEEYQHKSKSYLTTIPHLPSVFTADQIKSYKNNIIKKSQRRRFNYIISLLKPIVVLSIKKNVLVIKENLVDFDMYLLIEGKLNVYINGLKIGRLLPGAIFGEMSLLAHKHRRYADVKSITDIKIILIPRHLLHKLEQDKMQSANRLLHLLSNSLSEKLFRANKKLISYTKDLSK